MARDLGFKFLFVNAEVFLAPEIADGLRAVEAEVGPIGHDGGGLFTAVEQANGFGAVFKVSGPDFQGVIHRDATAGFAERILVHVEHFVIVRAGSA